MPQKHKKDYTRSVNNINNLAIDERSCFQFTGARNTSGAHPRLEGFTPNNAVSGGTFAVAGAAD